MFSLFRKKHIAVEVVSYEESRYVAGVQTMTEKKSYKSDVKGLQQRFYGLREKLAGRSNPSGTLVVFRNPDQQGRFSYFVGDLVDTPAQEKAFTVLTLEPGEYAEIHIKFKVPNDLALSVARAKCYFMETWLPGSGYALKDGVESMEFYDSRSSIRLPSIELMFPLQKRKDDMT